MAISAAQRSKFATFRRFQMSEKFLSGTKKNPKPKRKKQISKTPIAW